MNKKIISKGEATRAQLINVGARLFHQQGYNNTGLQQILKEAGIAKGSFYFHFKDKEAFALAIIDFYKSLFKDGLTHHLADESLSADKKIEAFHLYYLELFEKMQFKGGCPIGNFCQELAGVSSSFANKINIAFSGMAKCFASVIEQGQDSGIFKPELDSAATANFLVDSWEGAVLRMKAIQNAQPMENWYRFTQQILYHQTGLKK